MSKFIGRKIVPKHDGVWDISKEYEELSIVLDKSSGESYISRKPVLENKRASFCIKKDCNVVQPLQCPDCRSDPGDERDRSSSYGIC